MRRRKSSFIHGTDDDVRDLSAHLTAYLRGTVTAGDRRRDRCSAR
jgi:putative flavoprotein involved in K+ transport